MKRFRKLLIFSLIISIISCNSLTTVLANETKSVETIYRSTLQGTIPKLPTMIPVTYSDNTTKLFPVSWNPISKYSYQIAKDFTITGTIEDLKLPVECIMTVEPTRDLGFDLIRDDTYIWNTLTINNNPNYIVPYELGKKIYDTLGYYKYKYGIHASFTAISLKDYTTLSYNADLEYSPASTLKAPYALYVYKEIAKGNLSLDDYVTYQDYFWEVSSGIIKYSPPGTKWSLRDILFYTLNISDNTGYYMLRSKGGLYGYSEMLNNLGCVTPNPWYAWSKVTPHDLSVLWNEIYNFSFTCSEGELLLDTLINAEYNFIKEGLGTYEKVAHKSGFNENGYHDSAIIFGNSDPNTEFITNDYILTIMTKTYSYSINKQLLSELAKEIDAIMKDLTVFQNKNS